MSFKTWFLLARLRGWGIFLAPFRFILVLSLWESHREYYSKKVREFPVGIVVRKEWIPENERSIIRLSRQVQQHFSPHIMGKENEGGSRDIEDESGAKGSPVWSFFEAREPWVVEKVEAMPFSTWIGHKVLDIECHPVDCVIRPYFPESIVWHMKSAWGTDTFSVPSDLIEVFPSEDLLKMVSTD